MCIRKSSELCTGPRDDSSSLFRICREHPPQDLLQGNLCRSCRRPLERISMKDQHKESLGGFKSTVPATKNQVRASKVQRCQANLSTCTTLKHDSSLTHPAHAKLQSIAVFLFLFFFRPRSAVLALSATECAVEIDIEDSRKNCCVSVRRENE